MHKKRANGEGSFSQRRDGSWMCEVVVDGEERCFYGTTRAEAEAKFVAFQRQRVVMRGDLTVAEFLLRWVEVRAKEDVRARTLQNYETTIDRYIAPVIGHIKLRELQPEHVQRLVDFHARELAPRTVKNIASVLRRALDDAVVQRLIPFNVAHNLRMPEIKEYEPPVPTSEEAQALRSVLRGHPREGLYLLMLTLGLRKGEVLALHKDDIDLKGKTLRVTSQVQDIGGASERVPTKTDASKRTLPLPEELLPPIERALANQPRCPLLFPSEAGTPIGPRNLSRQFKELLKQAGVRQDIRIQDLRHFAATNLLESGLDIVTVQQILGHTDATFTLAQYGQHLPPPKPLRFPESFDRLFGGPPAGRKQKEENSRGDDQ